MAIIVDDDLLFDDVTPTDDTRPTRVSTSQLSAAQATELRRAGIAEGKRQCEASCQQIKTRWFRRILRALWTWLTKMPDSPRECYRSGFRRGMFFAIVWMCTGAVIVYGLRLGWR